MAIDHPSASSSFRLRCDCQKFDSAIGVQPRNLTIAMSCQYVQTVLEILMQRIGTRTHTHHVVGGEVS